MSLEGSYRGVGGGGLPWLSIGPAVKRILEQWEAVTQFVTDLAKDPKKLPRSINFKRVHMMLNAKEKMVTRVLLEFLNDVIPVFEQFYCCSREHHQ